MMKIKKKIKILAENSDDFKKGEEFLKNLPIEWKEFVSYFDCMEVVGGHCYLGEFGKSGEFTINPMIILKSNLKAFAFPFPCSTIYFKEDFFSIPYLINRSLVYFNININSFNLLQFPE